MLRRMLVVASAILTFLVAAMLAYAFWDAPPIVQRAPELGEDADVVVIGLISDTHRHIPLGGELVPRKVFEVFKDVDLIIHAGDITKVEVTQELEKMAPVVAVHGNVDPPEIRAMFPAMNQVKVHGWKNRGCA